MDTTDSLEVSAIEVTTIKVLTKNEKNMAMTEGKTLGCKCLKLEIDEDFKYFQSLLENIGDNWELMDIAMQNLLKPKKDQATRDWVTTDHINKVLISGGEEKIIIYGQGKSLNKEWINALITPFCGKIIEENESFVKAEFLDDSPIKTKDLVISCGLIFLRSKGYLPNRNDDDDDCPPELPDDW